MKRLTCVALLGLGLGHSLSAADQPNVVVIFADDLGYGDLGCYGATKVQTPNIDRLAAEGRRFTDAHSASAVCTPSRYALLTGEYPHRKNRYRPVFLETGLIVDTEQQTMADIMKDAGYATTPSRRPPGSKARANADGTVTSSKSLIGSWVRS